jgi:hypothetical protein
LAVKERTTGGTGASGGRRYFLEVDGQEYELDQAMITGGEIMDLAHIPHEQGLLELLEDGTQRQVSADEEVDLKPGKRFKKRPRFRRGRE